MLKKKNCYIDSFHNMSPILWGLPKEKEIVMANQEKKNWRPRILSFLAIRIIIWEIMIRGGSLIGGVARGAIIIVKVKDLLRRRFASFKN